MFYTTLRTIPPYTDEAYNRFMSNINGDSYKEDRSMIATLRALLFERLNGAEFLFRYFETDNLPYKDVPAEDLFECLFPIHCPYILVMRNLNDTPKEDFQNIVSILSEKYNEQSNIREYIEAKCGFSCAFFVEEESNSAYILTRDLNLRMYHLLQAFLFRCFPGLFAEKPVSDKEKVFLKTLTESSSASYLENILALSTQYDYRDHIVASQLSGFEKRARDAFLSHAKERMDNIRISMDNALGEYRRLLESFEEATIRVEGLAAMKKKASDDTDLIEYFKTHKMIDLERVGGRHLEITIRSYLNFFDVEGYESFSRNGDIYNDYSTRGTAFARKEDRKLLMDALFNDDPVLRVKMCAYFNLDIAGDVVTERNHEFGPAYENYLVNPHYHRHACLGANAPAIIECLQNGNIIGAIEQCVAATQRVNVFETSATFRPMLNEIFSSNKKIIQRNDGVDMTPQEALAWLKEQKNK